MLQEVGKGVCEAVLKSSLPCILPIEDNEPPLAMPMPMPTHVGYSSFCPFP